MKKSREIVCLTHANYLKKVWLVRENIDGWHESTEKTENEANKATWVYCTGGNVFPALEKPEQIAKIFKGEENV